MLRSHEEYKEMLSAYALDALDAEEARDVEAYLTEHDDLRDELKEWRETASLLAYAAPVVKPSIDVRARLLTNIGAREEITANEKNTPQTASNVVQFPDRGMRKSWNAIQIVTALAASLAIVFLSVFLWTTLQSNRANQAEIADLKNRLDDSQKQLEQARKDKEVVTSPDSVVVDLKATETAPNASARLVFQSKTGTAFLTVKGLPPVPAGKAYQIWYITDPKKPTPGKTFKPDATGAAVLSDMIPQNDLRASVFAVTIEDEKGATSPTGAMYLKSGT